VQDRAFRAAQGVMLHMRVSVLVTLLAVFAAATSVAQAAPPTSLDITAGRVNFYSNRFILTGDGNVRVRLSDGTVIRGQTFTMDLKLNRYLVAGAVQLDPAGSPQHIAGAAFAGYPDLDRSYFLPENVAPERWTFYGIDWRNRHEGREQPGDTFNFPDLTGERAYIVANNARVNPRTNIVFTLPRLYTAGIYTPLPRYVVTFSSNSHFFENAFPGARFDVGIPTNGSPNSLTALHIRNDPYNGTYLAFDQHFVWNQDWIAFGIDPLTQEERQYNLVAYKRISPNMESRLFAQVSAAQKGWLFNGAQNAAGFGELSTTAAFKGGTALNYTQDNYWQYLLGLPYGITNLGAPLIDYDPRWQDHPMNGLLSYYTTHDFTLLKLRTFSVQYNWHAALRLAHDIYGVGGGYPGDPPLKDDWDHFVGGTLETSPIALPGHLSFAAAYTREKHWFNVDHTQDFADSKMSVSGARERQHVRYFLAYEVQNIGDYWGNKQTDIYAPNADPLTTPFGTYTGQAAWRGLATNRAYTGSLVYTPTQWFELAVILSRHYDYPAPVPGAYGQPPWQFAGDVRVRVAKQILLDFSRQYYFNFADERWTPQFGIQVSP